MKIHVWVSAGSATIFLFIFFFLIGCGVIKYSATGTRTGIFAVAEGSGNRVLIWKQTPQYGQAPQIVLGQPDFTSNSANAGGSISAQGLSNPRSINTDGTHFILADSSNNRVLIWNSIPTKNQQIPDLVLGQPDFLSGAVNNTPGAPGTVSAQSIKSPQGSIFADGKVIVTDHGNNRFLIWNSMPTSNQQPADLVLGSNSMNVAGVALCTSTTFNDTRSAMYFDGKFFAGDLNNHRVLIWNTFPTQNGQAADIVLGQPDFVTGIPNPATSQTLTNALNMWTDGKRLAISDNGSSRVLIWNSIPKINQQAADIVLGQPDMTSSAVNNTPGNPGTPSAQSFNTPFGIVWDSKNFYVADSGNSRVLVWNSFPTINQQPADYILGQPNSSSGVKYCSTSVPSAFCFWDALGVASNASLVGVGKSDGY
jgi:hypothetical protein